MGEEIKKETECWKEKLKGYPTGKRKSEAFNYENNITKEVIWENLSVFDGNLDRRKLDKGRFIR